MMLFVSCNALPSAEMGTDPTTPSKREMSASTPFMKVSPGSETRDNPILILDAIAAPVLSFKSILVSRVKLVYSNRNAGRKDTDRSLLTQQLSWSAVRLDGWWICSCFCDRSRSWSMTRETTSWWPWIKNCSNRTQSANSQPIILLPFPSRRWHARLLLRLGNFLFIHRDNHKVVRSCIWVLRRSQIAYYLDS